MESDKFIKHTIVCEQKEDGSFKLNTDADLIPTGLVEELLETVAKTVKSNMTNTVLKDEAIKLMTDNTVMDILHGRRAFKIIAIIEGILILLLVLKIGGII